MDVSRRGALKAGLAAAAVAGTGAWREAAAEAARVTHGGPVRPPGSLPYPDLTAGTDTIPQIEHVVVLMMENHSYDNRLGMLRRPGADGFRLGRGGKPRATNPYADGKIQHAFHMPTTCQLNGHPAQDWLASHQQYANGKLDGFVESGSGPVAMGYWEKADQPFYYSLARTFPIADRYFCSVLGQTFPNRRYLLAATSIGQVNDTIPALTDYPANGTIFDQLDKYQITWKDYYTTLPSVELFPQLYLKNNGTKVVPIAGFFADAAAGTLPNYCLVEPDYNHQSEENPQNIVAGEAFAASVVNAVMSGPAWDKTVLLWTYDEHGGYYDHVRPPAAIPPDSIAPAVPSGQSAYDGFGRYGFRVPFALVSPWARPNYVSHRVFDHGSILKLVESKWNLPALTYRDANANAMLDMLDLRFPFFRRPPRLANPLQETDPASLACNVSGPGTIPPPGSVTG
ncbi:MAG TPA: alkaline phosphatase family protein [Streptosporangiaceae bacterium]|nr:alkaline phosphatase family protein [Streptosporangiaceae bacterium]